MDRLRDKVAIVTGAARGQGAATAERFAREGATVIATDVQESAGPQSTIRTLGGNARFHRLDVSDAEQWTAVAAATLGEFGRIDVLVNNAGIVHIADFISTTRSDFDKVLAVNLVGTFLGMQAVLPSMIAAGRGSIINISSISGLCGVAGMSAYSASKWAVRGLTRSVALEVAGRGVRINSIHPGAIDTPMVNPHGDLDSAAAAQQQRIAIGRLGRPEEVANATLFLASDEASYVTGTELAVDGAWTAGTTSDGAVDPNS